MNWWNSLTDLQRILASIAAPATLFMVLQFILLLFGFIHDGDVDSVDGADDGDLGGHEHSLFCGHDAPDGHDFLDGAGIADHDALGGHDIADTHDFIGDHDAADSHEHGDHGHGAGDKADTLRLFTLRGIVAFLSIGGWAGVVAIDLRLPDILAIILALATGWLALWSVAWVIRAFVRMQSSGNIKKENAVGLEGDVYLTIPVNGRGKVNVIVQERLCEMDAVSKADRPIKTGEKIKVIGITKEGDLLVEPKPATDQKEETIPKTG